MLLLAAIAAEAEETFGTDQKERMTITHVEAANISQTSNPFAYFASPGMLVMFSLFFFLGGGVAIVFEREEGTLPRLVMMPIHKASIILGKLIGIYVVGILQMVVLILVGIYLFNVNWGQSPTALVAVVLSFALAASGLGIAMAAFVNTPGQATALTNIIVMGMCALGGAWWPLEITPG